MDLGSAVLRGEMALDMLPPERRSLVSLCETPLVEGAIAAAAQARLGSPLAQAIAEALGALAAKASHLGRTAVAPEEARLPAENKRGEGDRNELRLTIRNQLGLHARPAARFVQTAGQYPGAAVRLRDLTTGRGPGAPPASIRWPRSVCARARDPPVGLRPRCASRTRGPARLGRRGFRGSARHHIGATGRTGRSG